MPGSDRSRADETLALLLAEGKTIADAASQAQVSPSTVQRRLKQPSFRELVAKRRREMFGEAVGRLSRLGGNAVDALQVLLDDEDARTRLGAAKAILDNLFRGMEASSFLEEVEALKAEIVELKSHAHFETE